jgi:predicted ArsR family transcriptional regulator
MDQPGSGLAAVGSLGDPVRRSLYEFVAGSPGPVGRDEAAAAAGIGRPLAAYHLDKLVSQGLLTASYQRPAGRGGPGAARLLAGAVEADPSGASRAALHGVARQFGADLGKRDQAAEPGREDTLQSAEDALRGHGFEPWHDEDGTVRLRNCPFHRLAAQHTEVVCGMNLALIEGLVAGLGATGLQPALDPQPGWCCVVLSTDTPRADAERTGLS